MLLAILAVAAVVACTSPETDKGTVIFGDLDWPSAQLQNRIAQYLVEFGYGYSTDVKFGSTLPLFEDLENGVTHVAMEIWLPNQEEEWGLAIAEGAVISLGKSLGTDWQSAFVIPAYLQEQYPDLDNVEDLKEQKYKDLFKTAETGNKARLVSCGIGWACEGENAAQIQGHGLEEHVRIVNAADGDALNSDLVNAYERRDPWLGYQWGTNQPALTLDLVRLEEPPYNHECYYTTYACAYEDATILVAVNSDLLSAAPEVIEMLRRWDFNVETYKAAVQWQAQNPEAGNAATALWWLRGNESVWSAWVTADAAESVKAALADGDEPEGWPDY